MTTTQNTFVDRLTKDLIERYLAVPIDLLGLMWRITHLQEAREAYKAFYECLMEKGDRRIFRDYKMHYYPRTKRFDDGRPLMGGGANGLNSACEVFALIYNVFIEHMFVESNSVLYRVLRAAFDEFGCANGLEKMMPEQLKTTDFLAMFSTLFYAYLGHTKTMELMHKIIVCLENAIYKGELTDSFVSNLVAIAQINNGISDSELQKKIIANASTEDKEAMANWFKEYAPDKGFAQNLSFYLVITTIKSMLKTNVSDMASDELQKENDLFYSCLEKEFFRRLSSNTIRYMTDRFVGDINEIIIMSRAISKVNLSTNLSSLFYIAIGASITLLSPQFRAITTSLVGSADPEPSQEYLDERVKIGADLSALADLGIFNVMNITIDNSGFVKLCEFLESHIRFTHYLQRINKTSDFYIKILKPIILRQDFGAICDCLTSEIEY